MPADALAPYIARSSLTVVLIKQNKLVLVFLSGDGIPVLEK